MTFTSELGWVCGAASVSNAASMFALTTENHYLALGTFVLTVGGVSVTLIKTWWDGRNAAIGRDLAIAQARLHDQEVSVQARLDMMTTFQERLTTENTRLMDALLRAGKEAITTLQNGQKTPPTEADH